MAHYLYEGKHFELPDGLSNEEAIGKIETFLGKPLCLVAAKSLTSDFFIV